MIADVTILINGMESHRMTRRDFNAMVDTYNNKINERHATKFNAAVRHAAARYLSQHHRDEFDELWRQQSDAIPEPDEMDHIK